MKRVFISFRIEDKPQVNGLRLLAANPNYDLEFYDESVRSAYNSTNAAYIRSRIRQKILRTSVTVCILNRLTHTSEWVAWELRESIAKGNQIIGMGVPGLTQAITLPQPMRDIGASWDVWDVPALMRKIGA
ncbi:TIR domain-containing protein [Sphingomonas adhaesiva]|uniref:TIR domain-containing protein n=1 Tax=Sphingomonas adhaesiva TaxID=28212 RepID=UPI003FA692D8